MLTFSHSQETNIPIKVNKIEIGGEWRQKLWRWRNRINKTREIRIIAKSLEIEEIEEIEKKANKTEKKRADDRRVEEI